MLHIDVLYIQSNGDTPLQPFLALLYPSSEPQPLFQATYTSHHTENPPIWSAEAIKTIVMYGGEEGEPMWFEGLDWEVEEAKRLVEECSVGMVGI